MGADIHAIIQIRKNGKWQAIKDLPKEFKKRNYTFFGLLAGVRDHFGDNVFKPKGLPEDLGETKYFFESYTPSGKKRYESETERRCVLPDGSFLSHFDSSLLKVISRDEYETIKALSDEEKKPRYSNLGWRESRGEKEYYVYDASIVSGYFDDIPVNKIYKTFPKFMAEYYADEWDSNKADYGIWTVDFSCEDYHTHSYISLKEFDEADYSEYFSFKYKMSKNFYDAFIAAGGVMPDIFKISESAVGDIGDAFREASMPTITISWPITEAEKHESVIWKAIEALHRIADRYEVTNTEDLRVVFAFDN